MTAISSPQPAQSEIAACAYAIWEKAGRPAGCEMTHWLEAEQQLKNGGSANTVPSSTRTLGENSRSVRRSQSKRQKGALS